MPPHSHTKHTEHVHAQVDSRAPARSAIAASWRRSMFHHGLDPELRLRHDILTKPELDREKERLDLLLHIATPIMEHLFVAVVKTGSCVVLTNKDSVILHRLVHDVDTQSLNQLGARSGAIWSEETTGTNGIGTCAHEERPVVIHKNQHYREEIIGMSCAGAPIFDATGQLIAVLDISSARDDTDDSFANVMASLVNSSANRIETEYFRACFNGAKITVADGSMTHGTPLLASDQDDLVIGANRAARRMFGLVNESFANPLPRHEILSEETPQFGLLDAERAAIRRALAATRGNATQAAKDLGVSRATFYRLLKKHNLTA